MKLSIRILYLLIIISSIQFSCSEEVEIIEICNNGIDDDSDGVVDCEDADCNGFVDCASSMREICDDGIDDDGDSVTDCEDADCNSFTECNSNRTREICNNNIDDDGDGLTDCNDSDCNSFTPCIMDSIEICNNGIDDDGDGLTDCGDWDCYSFSGCYACSVFDGGPFTGSKAYGGQFQIVEFPQLTIVDSLIFVRNPSMHYHMMSIMHRRQTSNHSGIPTSGFIYFPNWEIDEWPIRPGEVLNDVIIDSFSIEIISCYALKINYHSVSIGSSSVSELQGETFPLENLNFSTIGQFIRVE